MAGFITLVQDLPPELFTAIYDHVFTAERGEVVTVDKKYRPPKLLQVNTSSRKRFATSYYDRTTFQFDSAANFSTIIKTLSQEHCLLLQHVLWKFTLLGDESEWDYIRVFEKSEGLDIPMPWQKFEVILKMCGTTFQCKMRGITQKPNVQITYDLPFDGSFAWTMRACRAMNEWSNELCRIAKRHDFNM